MASTASVAQLVAPVVFVAFMAVLLPLGFAVSYLLDPALWVPKRSGLGWTIDFANPHAWLVTAYTLVWVGCLVLGLSHPDVLGIRTLIQFLSGLIGVS